jgi:ribonuclease PH
MTLRLGLYLALAAAGLVAGWRIVDMVAAGKVTTATESYNQENRDVADAVAEAKQRVRACYAGGGLWDRQAGQCQRPVPRSRQ